MMTDEEYGKLLGQKLNEVMGGDINAVRFALGVVAIAHVWDDVIDGDKEVGKERLDAAFYAVMGRMMTNPFFQAHVHALGPLMHSTILQWRDANKLEQSWDGNREHLAHAMMLRSFLSQLVSYCIFLVGGEEWYEKYGIEWQRWFAKDMARHYREFEEELKRCLAA